MGHELRIYLGNVALLRAYDFRVNFRILCDTGAFCNCISLQFYNKIKSKNSITPKSAGTGFKAVNNHTLDVLGTVELNVKIAGLVIPGRILCHPKSYAKLHSWWNVFLRKQAQ